MYCRLFRLYVETITLRYSYCCGSQPILLAVVGAVVCAPAKRVYLVDDYVRELPRS